MYILSRRNPNAFGMFPMDLNLETSVAKELNISRGMLTDFCCIFCGVLALDVSHLYFFLSQSSAQMNPVP